MPEADGRHVDAMTSLPIANQLPTVASRHAGDGHAEIVKASR